jgi:hypothetical protein
MQYLLMNRGWYDLHSDSATRLFYPICLALKKLHTEHDVCCEALVRPNFLGECMEGPEGFGSKLQTIDRGNPQTNLVLTEPFKIRSVLNANPMKQPSDPSGKPSNHAPPSSPNVHCART